MAEIHILPVGAVDADRIRRLTDNLAAAFEAGEDLGSRAPHIRASAQAFADMASELEAGVAKIVETLDTLGLEHPAHLATIARLVGACRGLSRAVADYPQPAS